MERPSNLRGIRTKAERRIEPLRAVKSALNLKIAAHLGLSVTRDVERQFDVVLPPW